MAQSAAARRFLLISDPGPDPDDIKALAVAAVLHSHAHIRLIAVVANGGGQPRARACLARCVLDHLGAHRIPVGIGSLGKPSMAQPHEFAMEGFAEVDEARLVDGAALMRQVLNAAPRKSVRVVCISSLRDFADICASDPELILAKVHSVHIQGGLERSDSAPSGWTADSSVNNLFDLEAANAVYAFCFARGLAMAVTSRLAVPLLPMHIARSFAETTACPVMHYLAQAQYLGLEGLWHKLCDGELPARCSKAWYFETFCGVPRSDFDPDEHGTLGKDADIVGRLNGYVKPYDVVALMAALPRTELLFTQFERVRIGGVEHRLLIEPAHAPELEHVVELLRDVYHEVVLATGGGAKGRVRWISRGGLFRSRARWALRLRGPVGATTWISSRYSSSDRSQASTPVRWSQDAGSKEVASATPLQVEALLRDAIDFARLDQLLLTFLGLFIGLGSVDFLTLECSDRTIEASANVRSCTRVP